MALVSKWRVILKNNEHPNYKTKISSLIEAQC